MKVLILLFTTTFYCLHSFSQIKVIDKSTKETIPFVYIIDKDAGKVIGNFDLNGSFDKSNFPSNIKNIKLSHVSYQDSIFSSKDFLQKDVIELLPDIVLLKETTITPPKDYTVLKGYFRQYVIENDIPKYYSDGIIDYFYPKKPLNKRLLSFKLQEYRNFRNSNINDLDESKRKIKFSSEPPIPYLQKKSTLEIIQKSYDLSPINAKGQINIKHKKEDLGTILVDKNKVEVSIDFISNNNRSKVMRIFEHDFQNVNEIVFEEYSKNESETLNDVQFFDNKRAYRLEKVKHRKDKDFNKIETVYEFYLMEKKEITETTFEQIELTNPKEIRGKSKVSYPYWNEIKEAMDIPKTMQDFIKSEMNKN